jgi:hypothetical protein
MATGDTRVLPGPASMGMPDRSDLSDIARWIGYTGWALLSTQPIRLALVLGLSGALSTIAWAAGFFFLKRRGLIGPALGETTFLAMYRHLEKTPHHRGAKAGAHPEKAIEFLE